jgi:hypothetical protein
MAEAHFPLWALVTEMAAVPITFVFFGLLLRRLRLVHPATWEELGQPSLFIWAWPGSIIALLDRVDANCRLLVFPFRTRSFQLDNAGTAVLLWVVRATLGVLLLFRVWSWWVNP